MRRRAVGAIVAFAALPGALSAQGLSLGVSRWLKSPQVTEYKVGVDGFGRGVFRFVVSAEYVEQGGTSKAHWYGGTGDVLIRATPTAQPYLIAGAGVGAGRGPTGGGESPGVGAWGGMGVELFTLGPLGVQAEGLYTWRSKVDLSGFAIGLRLGSRIGKREGASPPAVVPPGPPAAAPAPAAVRLPIANPADEEAIRLALAGLPAGGTPPPPGAPIGHPAAAEIVVSAIGVMGTPYRWGGTDSTGYDCSGLIQYAYSQHGITLPRRSVDQAGAGREVGEGRRVDSLLPGDILTFSAEPGGQVAHVGLYVGNGRFIHSASKGVAIGVLRADDPAIKWWWERWVGARRIVE